MENKEYEFEPWRVFINHIDGYHGKKIAECLSKLRYVDRRSGDARNDKKDETEGSMGELEPERWNEDDEKNDFSGIGRNYEVVGTLQNRECSQPEITESSVTLQSSSNRVDLFFMDLMKCGVVIYDISQDSSQVEEARWVLKEIARKLDTEVEDACESLERIENVRYFILISTVMTWALTKSSNPEESDSWLTEADYKKRKPHPSYRDHLRCEREVVIVKKRKNLTRKLRTLVICSGVTYGDEEGPLHFLFKMAWLNAEWLPVIGNGDNEIPLLHVRDLATIVSRVMVNWPTRLRYIVAVEQEVLDQTTIVKSISDALSNGRIKKYSRDESLLLREMTQKIYDTMTLKLKLKPAYIVDVVPRWHFNGPFYANIERITEEYKLARDLRSIKVIVLGPPASGKTKIARFLAEHYKIHYIHVKSLITDTIESLTKGIEHIKKIKDQKSNERLEMQEQLGEIRNGLSANNGRLDDTILNKLFAKRLSSRDCLNQGYVLDGYPKTLEQARDLFRANIPSDEETKYDDDRPPGIDWSIMPDLVVLLEASDDFLIDRIISRPEKEIQHTHYTEEHMIRRLREYRNRNTDDKTPLLFFDELELHPLIISIENDSCPDMTFSVRQCMEEIGAPKNYDAKETAKVERRAKEIAEELAKEEEALECKRKREQKMKEWTNLLDKLKQEEEERLSIEAEPLRHYLVKYILPTLTKGLIEVTKLRPDDPIDFLAEYLFKENPEGKIFEPDYSETMKILLEEIESVRSEALPTEDLNEEIIEFN